jgi:hypothetical protein
LGFRWVLLAMGAFSQSRNTTEIVGGGGGSEFYDSENRGINVVEVRVWAGEMVDAVQMIFEDNGRRISAPKHGGGGGRLNTFRLQRGEYITGISGRYGDYIDSIQIHTNRNTSPTYGGRGGGRNFNIDVPRDEQAVGFAGRAGKYVDAIGLVYSGGGRYSRDDGYDRDRDRDQKQGRDYGWNNGWGVGSGWNARNFNYSSRSGSGDWSIRNGRSGRFNSAIVNISSRGAISVTFEGRGQDKLSLTGTVVRRDNRFVYARMNGNGFLRGNRLNMRGEMIIKMKSEDRVQSISMRDESRDQVNLKWSDR